MLKISNGITHCTRFIGLNLRSRDLPVRFKLVRTAPYILEDEDFVDEK